MSGNLFPENCILGNDSGLSALGMSGKEKSKMVFLPHSASRSGIVCYHYSLVCNANWDELRIGHHHQGFGAFKNDHKISPGLSLLLKLIFRKHSLFVKRGYPICRRRCLDGEKQFC